MKCVLTGQNAIILARVIHSFSRIGNELFIEADSRNGLSLRTINMTKSAFSMIMFNMDFFTSFRINPKADEFENQCKLSMKSCLSVFRNMKQVETCIITLDSEKCKMIVQFKCRLETIKIHHIPIMEYETLQASYITDKAQNILAGNHKLFSNIVSNFKTNEEELSVKVTERDVLIQNYVEGSHVDNRFVRSHITLKPDEFENYKIGEETTITFCMRELRAILNFAESMNTSISANFETPGKPVVFVIKNFNTFEANLVMSTLSPEDEEYEREKNRTNSQSQSQNGHHIDLEQTAASSENGSQSSTSSSMLLRKRNLSRAERSRSDSIDRLSPLDVLRKKRRTDARETIMPQVIPHVSNANGSESPSTDAVDFESEEIQVILQEDSDDIPPPRPSPSSSLSLPHSQAPPIPSEPMVWETSEQAPQIITRNKRDHRPQVRNLFLPCFTGYINPNKNNLGQVLADCSDEE